MNPVPLKEIFEKKLPPLLIIELIELSSQIEKKCKCQNFIKYSKIWSIGISPIFTHFKYLSTGQSVMGFQEFVPYLSGVERSFW